MRRKLIAVIAGGAVAGAASALIAYATLADHASTASDQGQPSTLLESAASNGGGTLATAPSWPGQPAETGGGGGGSSSSPAGRSQTGAGAVVVHGIGPTPPPSSGGDVSGGTWPLGQEPASSPDAAPTPSGGALPTLPAIWLPTPTPPAVPTATATPAHATATPTPSGGGQVTVSVPPLPLPLPTLQPVCVLLICIKP